MAVRGEAREQTDGGRAVPDVVSRSELAGLYRDLHHRLEQIVRAEVRAPSAVIEDACQCAWSRLLDHPIGIRQEAALSWLARTAAREAVRQFQRERRERSLEILKGASDRTPPPPSPVPEELALQRERLEALDELPRRQRRLVWLHGFGLSYAEMARHEGYSERTVERQLMRARRKIRAAA